MTYHIICVICDISHVSHVVQEEQRTYFPFSVIFVERSPGFLFPPLVLSAPKIEIAKIKLFSKNNEDSKKWFLFLRFDFISTKRKKWQIETKKVFPREDRKWKHAAEVILNTRFCQNAQPRSDDRSLLHNRLAPTPLCLAPHIPFPGVHAHVQHLLPLLWPPDQPLTAASAGQGKTMWACGYPQCSLQVISKPLHLHSYNEMD